MNSRVSGKCLYTLVTLCRTVVGNSISVSDISHKLLDLPCLTLNTLDITGVNCLTMCFRYPGSTASDIYLGDVSCIGQLVNNTLVISKGIDECTTTTEVSQG